MIDIREVSKSFEGHKVLDKVSFRVKKGTIHGIIGENGVGKTTLLQCLGGIYRPDEGVVEIEGENIWENEAVKENVGYVADRNQFFKNNTVKEMVEFFELMYKEFNRDDFNTYNKVFQINPKLKVKQLSKGMQMRLAFMLSLATHPKVLILDEPTSGLVCSVLLPSFIRETFMWVYGRLSIQIIVSSIVCLIIGYIVSRQISKLGDKKRGDVGYEKI